MKSKRWYLKSSLENEDNIISQILRDRGINKNKESEFLNTSFSNLDDPYIFKDMKRAVNLILDTIENEGKIIIYGDYDVDGITSTSLLLLFFREYLDFKVDYYIPDRKEEGYGLNENSINEIISENYDLMITVDCGITAFKEIELANKNNLKTIITDHHQPANKLPKANSLINPHLEKCSYPFKKFAGVGVAFKLCQAIVKKKEQKLINDKLKSFLDIVALGTVADIVSLTGENRIFVKKGLDLINKSKRLAFKVLQKKLSLSNKKITTGHISFILAPPFNASGRMESANLGVEFLITRDENKVNLLAKKLIELNKNRQKEEKKTFEEADEMIKKNYIDKDYYAYVLYSKNWHPGVIGIVASKLVEKYYKPVIMIAIDDKGVGKGSARSIKKVNLFKVLTKHEKYFINFGGHSQAAGLSIKEEKIEDFREVFNEYLKKNLSTNDFVPEQRIDLIIEEKDIDLNLYENIEKLTPFGIDNPKPVFAIRNSKITKCYQVGKNNKHLKLETEKGLKAIAFNMGEKAFELNNKVVDFAFNLSLNEWKGNKNVEANIKDIKLNNEFEDYSIKFKTNKLTFFDKRNCKDKAKFLKKNIINSNNSNISIYKNNDEKFPVDEKIDVQINYLSSAEDIKDINSDKLFFFSLPDSLNEMTKIISSFKFNPEIYLLYGKKDYYLKYDELRKQIPNRKMLAEFYKLIYSKNDELRYGELNNLAKNKLKLKNNFIEESIEVFSELNLIVKKENSILIKAKPNRKLDLSDSLRYNKNASFIKKFNDFAKMAFANNLFLLISKIQNNLKEDKDES
ncbi:MAG: single-stranded-DNA-specific exonuclease RecJ [Bacillota bacterium]